MGEYSTLNGEKYLMGLIRLEDDNILMIGRSDAPTYAKRVMADGAIVLGFEGFQYDGKNLITLMDCIADFGGDILNVQSVLNILSHEEFKKAHFIEFVLK